MPKKVPKAVAAPVGTAGPYLKSLHTKPCASIQGHQSIGTMMMHNTPGRACWKRPQPASPPPSARALMETGVPAARRRRAKLVFSFPFWQNLKPERVARSFVLVHQFLFVACFCLFSSCCFPLCVRIASCFPFFFCHFASLLARARKCVIHPLAPFGLAALRCAPGRLVVVRRAAWIDHHNFQKCVFGTSQSHGRNGRGPTPPARTPLAAAAGLVLVVVVAVGGR